MLNNIALPALQVSQLMEDDPEVRTLGRQIYKVLRLSAEKAVAHHNDPSTYPISEDVESLEQILLNRFVQMRPIAQQVNGARFMKSVNASKKVRDGYYGGLNMINLHDSKSVEAQFSTTPRAAVDKPPKEDRPVWDVMTLADKITSDPRLPKPSPGSPESNSLTLCLAELKCIDETDGLGGLEWGEDEIHLAVVAVTPTGYISKWPQTKIGDFDTGDIHVPGLNPAFEWVPGAGPWPKEYHVTLILVEADEGGNDVVEFIAGLSQKMSDKISHAAGASLGALVGSGVGPLGTAIGAGVGAAVSWAISEFVSGWEDDIFDPQIVSMIIPSGNARWLGDKRESPVQQVSFKGHGGLYRLSYHWKLERHLM